MAAKGIPVGAAVRSNATGKLGRTFRNADGNPRGHVFVQWDGERDRQTVRISEVTLVADWLVIRALRPARPRS